MGKALIDKIDELYEEDEMDDEDIWFLDEVDTLFAKGHSVSAEVVEKIEAMWSKYCG